MTYEEIFSYVKNKFMKSDVSNINDNIAIEIDIIGEGEGAFYAKLANGTLEVEPYEYYDRDVKLIATADDFIKIVDGNLDSVLAYTTKKLKIEGSIEKALVLNKIIKNVKKAESTKVKASRKLKKLLS